MEEIALIMKDTMETCVLISAGLATQRIHRMLKDCQARMSQRRLRDSVSQPSCQYVRHSGEIGWAYNRHSRPLMLLEVLDGKDTFNFSRGAGCSRSWKIVSRNKRHTRSGLGIYPWSRPLECLTRFCYDSKCLMKRSWLLRVRSDKLSGN